MINYVYNMNEADKNQLVNGIVHNMIPNFKEYNFDVFGDDHIIIDKSVTLGDKFESLEIEYEGDFVIIRIAGDTLSINDSLHGRLLEAFRKYKTKILKASDERYDEEWSDLCG